MGGGSLFELIFRNSWLESFHSPCWFRGGLELDVVPDGLEVEVRQLGVRVRVAGDVKVVGIVLPRKIPVSLKVGRCMSLLRRWPTRPRCQRPKVTRWWCHQCVSGATARRAAPAGKSVSHGKSFAVPRKAWQRGRAGPGPGHRRALRIRAVTRRCRRPARCSGQWDKPGRDRPCWTDLW